MKAEKLQVYSGNKDYVDQSTSFIFIVCKYCSRGLYLESPKRKDALESVLLSPTVDSKVIILECLICLRLLTLL